MKKSGFEMPFWILKGISWLILKIGFAFEVRGLEHVESLEGKQQGLILAGNHTGLLDSLALFAGYHRYFRFLMTEEVFTWRWVGRLVPYGNIIPLYKKREKRALVECFQSLRQGNVICIFPEGKLSLDGRLSPFNQGVAFLQEKSRVPVVPFVIHGGFEAWPTGRHFPVFRKIVLEFGEALPAGIYENRAEMVQRLTQRVEAMQVAENTLRPLTAC